MSKRPKAVLFDIGGVCVVSPFQAILDYEKRQNIPVGWINHAISSSSPNGSWQRLERGEIALDAAFFQQFHADLTDEKLWKQYHMRSLTKGGDDEKAKLQSAGQAAEETLFNAPPPPHIDAEWLYWEMMRISRSPDPHMYPALQRLRLAANREREEAEGQAPSGAAAQEKGFLIAALSNTSIFPADHEFSRTDTPEGRFGAELRAHFDVFVSSAHVGMRKPDADIYEYAIAQLDALAKKKGMGGVRAGEIVFLDDIGGNLKTARGVGMRTVKVTLGRADLAVKELEAVMGLDLSTTRAAASKL